MIKYRPQRGSLSDAMKEYREFFTIDEMFDYVVRKYGDGILFTKADLSIGEDLGEDERIGWTNSHHILTNRSGDRDFIKMYGVPQCVGWCSID